MKTKILIDNIMRQTTVLIAQLTASAGIRAPMAHFADEVFLHLSEELERQGVAQKVVADMFGVALRSYQRKVARLRESSTDSGQTLWEAVLEYVERNEPLSRSEVIRNFNREDPNSIRSVLRDLISGGIIAASGRSGDAMLECVPESQRAALARRDDNDGLSMLLWLHIARHRGCKGDEIAARLSLPASAIEESLRSLIQEGQVQQDKAGGYTAESLHIPLGAEAGWETAVYDHFQAMCVALVAKLQRGRTQSSDQDTTGGTTITFDIHPGHPEESRVRNLLQRFNDEVDEVWQAVELHNKAHPPSADQLEPITFYFGQSTRRGESET